MKSSCKMTRKNSTFPFIRRGQVFRKDIMSALVPSSCRGTGRLYKRLTIMISLCIAFSLMIRVFINTETLDKDIQVQDIEYRNALIFFRPKPLQANVSSSIGDSKDMNYLKSESHQQLLSEFAVHTPYDQRRRPLTRKDFQFDSYRKTTEINQETRERHSSAGIQTKKASYKVLETNQETKERHLSAGMKTTKSPYYKAQGAVKHSINTSKLQTTKRINDIQPVVLSEKRHNRSTSLVHSIKKYHNRTNVERKILQDSSASGKKVAESSKLHSTNSQRLSRVSAACSKFGNFWRQYRPQAEFYHSPKHNLLYCKVAKGGCTFWEQLFSFILRQDSMKADNYSTMYDIPRWRIHFDKTITPPAHYWSSSLVKIGQNTTRFMFTRDPFSRIWSAYVDKIWLPDFWYWIKIGTHRTLNIKHRCLYDVTFADFVEYISDKDKSNKHWAPVHQSCNPCVFQPHILGNMSTFVDDAKQILQASGLDSYLSQYDHNKRVSIELKMLVQYNYVRFKNRNRIFQHCNFTEKDLAYRLWRTFQINGYISKEQRFPQKLWSYSENNVLKSILSSVESFPLSREESSSQRQSYLHQAYKSVPYSITKAMIKRFDADFYLFGFDRNPSYLLQAEETPVPFHW